MNHGRLREHGYAIGVHGSLRTARCRRGHVNYVAASYCSTCGWALPVGRLRRRFRWHWHWLMGRTFWRLYPSAVSRGPVTCWLWKLRHGRPCSDEILRDAWKAHTK